MRVRRADLKQGDRHMSCLLEEAMGVRAGDQLKLEGLDGLWQVLSIGQAWPQYPLHRVELA